LVQGDPALKFVIKPEKRRDGGVKNNETPHPENNIQRATCKKRKRGGRAQELGFEGAPRAEFYGPLGVEDVGKARSLFGRHGSEEV